MTDNIVTEDWSNFGWREKKMAIELLKKWMDGDVQRVLDGLEAESGVRAALNRHSGYVFLTNNDYDAFMINGAGKIDIHLNCPECGEEGFPPYLMKHGDDCCKEHAKHWMDEDEIKEMKPPQPLNGWIPIAIERTKLSIKNIYEGKGEGTNNECPVCAWVEEHLNINSGLPSVPEDCCNKDDGKLCCPGRDTCSMFITAVDYYNENDEDIDRDIILNDLKAIIAILEKEK